MSAYPTRHAPEPWRDGTSVEEVVASLATVLEFMTYEMDAGDAFGHANGQHQIRSILMLSARACRDLQTNECDRLADLTADLLEYPTEKECPQRSES